MTTQQGALIQLHARGLQDEILYGPPGAACMFRSPGITRNTIFSKETREFPVALQLGSETVIEIPRDGDLLGDIYLEITVPAVPGTTSSDTWVPNLGFAILNRVKFTIDDLVVHDHERLWMDIQHKLTKNPCKNIDAMIGLGPGLPMNASHTLLIPMRFFFCKSNRPRQVFLPIVQLFHAKMNMKISIEKSSNLTSYTRNLPTTFETRVLCDYVTIDAPERERMLRAPETLMLESVQDCEALSHRVDNDPNGGGLVALESVRVDLSEINAPVKYLAWVSYRSGDPYFTYTSDISESTVRVNGRELAKLRNNAFWRLPHLYARGGTVDPASGIGVFSFALDTGAYQPSGHLNFDHLPTPDLVAVLRTRRTDVTVKVFAVTYKWLSFAGGKASLKFV